MIPDDLKKELLSGALRGVLDAHGVRADPDMVDALVARASMTHRTAARKRSRRTTPLGWNAEERKAAVAHARSLLCYRDAPPRNSETAANRRDRLVKLVDPLPVQLRLTATRRPDGSLLNFDLLGLRDALRGGTETREQLTAFIEAVAELPEPSRTGRPRAPYAPLLHGALDLWERQFGPQSVTASIAYPAEAGTPTMVGPLADFLRDVFPALEMRWPGDEPVHQQLRKLKNPET